MASYIPFVHSKNDIPILKKFYSDADIARVSLAARDVIKNVPTNIWLDPAVDIYHKWPPGDKKLESYFKPFDKHGLVTTAAIPRKPNIDHVYDFIKGILDECHNFKPAWLSIPQLPMVSNKSRFGINRAFASATAKWRTENQFRGKLILPVIITRREQVNLKKHWKDIIDLVQSCYSMAVADGIWVVDSNLNDQLGFSTLEDRFRSLVNFHNELNNATPDDTIIIAGPYWGMNLVLWARGLVTFPAIGLGRGYQYHIPGFYGASSKYRIAIPPLRRRAVKSPDFEAWLHRVIKSIPKNTNAFREFNHIIKNWESYDSRSARRQIAGFYREWLSLLEEVPPLGRSLALYQDLSNAYVLGKSFSESLPRSEGAARSPERIVKQLMLQCL